jgi:hypothetical protein
VILKITYLVDNFIMEVKGSNNYKYEQQCKTRYDYTDKYVYAIGKKIEFPECELCGIQYSVFKGEFKNYGRCKSCNEKEMLNNNKII